MQILLVEDDERVATYVAKGLRESGHLVHHLRDGRNGLLQAMTEDYELIILDRMLPQLDGMAVLKALRAAGNDTPVLILTALGDVDERVLGLESGADDYLSKPFAMTELLARVNVLGRRSRPPAEESHITVADLEINLLSRSVRRAGQRIDLTPREFRLLEVLARSADRVVTRSMLLERVWEYSFDPQTNIVDQFMSKLRQKIDRDFDRPLIHTVRGAGYVLRRTP
ncbi:winged helix-turn-helix domain-containing protein [Roseomonas xinghualingensis]|uniref:winged helix-turn-helix domain-containing protein n=1 Tax=Roseomonas xinghualingensis TaxID=2986475 RepID=UPI0021F191AB|nr:response regulator transcription factor [Roseomonas sp. SXEYE001]MCV4210296.1 response regulator transcription factor [Roseomonas sp. SXEYE001]